MCMCACVWACVYVCVRVYVCLCARVRVPMFIESLMVSGGMPTVCVCVCIVSGGMPTVCVCVCVRLYAFVYTNMSKYMYEHTDSMDII